MRDRVIRDLENEIQSLKTKIMLVQRACKLILSIQNYEDESDTNKNKTVHKQEIRKSGLQIHLPER